MLRFMPCPRARSAVACAALMLLLASIAPLAGAQEEAPPTPEELLPLQPREDRFLIVEGDDRGERTTQTLQRDESHPQRWILNLQGYERVYLDRTEDGSIVVPRIDLVEDGRGAVYSPPVLLLPADLRVRPSHETRSEARIIDLDSGEVSDEGIATHRVREIARSRITTPAGTVRGYTVVIEHVIDLDLADVELDLEIAFAPGVGIVYRRSRSVTERLGLFGEMSVTAAAIEAPDQPAP